MKFGTLSEILALLLWFRHLVILSARQRQVCLFFQKFSEQVVCTFLTLQISEMQLVNHEKELKFLFRCYHDILSRRQWVHIFFVAPNLNFLTPDKNGSDAESLTRPKIFKDVNSFPYV